MNFTDADVVNVSAPHSAAGRGGAGGRRWRAVVGRCAALTLVGAALAGCNPTGAIPPEISPYGGQSGGSGEYAGQDIPFAAGQAPLHSQVEQIAGYMNAIGNQMTQQAYSQGEVARGENFAFSPASLYVALAALGTLADADLEAQFSDFMGVDAQLRAKYTAALITQLREHAPQNLADLASEDIPEELMIHIANNIVIKDGVGPLGEQYVATLRGDYDADILYAALGQMQGILDTWVRENTGGLIDQSALQVTPDFLLGLQSALYFAGPWDTPFEEAATVDKPFFGVDNERTTAPMMNAIFAADGFIGREWTGLRLPIGDGEYYAEFLMPGSGHPSEYDSAAIASAREGFTDQVENTDMFIPKFKVTTKMPLLDALAQAGLSLENVPGFTAVDHDAVVHQAVQQVVLDVKEAGVRAAAVTEFGMVESAAPGSTRQPRVIRIDHPFWFFIRSADGGEELFSAVIVDPTQ